MSFSQPDILVDARRQGWFWMEDAVIDTYGRALGAIGVAIYAYLARRSDPRGVSFPSYGTIARDLNLGRRTVIKYIHKLEELGLIVVHRRNGQGRASNVYQLVSGREPDPVPPVAGANPPEAGQTSEPEPVIALPIAAVPVPTGAGDAPVQSEHQSGVSGNGVIAAPVQEMHQSDASDTGAMATPVQQVHPPGAGAAPRPVHEMHPTGAPVAPKGNTLKETQRKETQMKEKEDLASRATRVASPGDPSLHSSQRHSVFGFLALEKQAPPKQEPEPEAKEPELNAPTSEEGDELTAMLDALAQVTGKNLAFLRPQKREQFQIAAQKLLDYGFTPEEVRDFGRYWREGHPIGSNKRNAGRPHLSQVLEDLPASRDWNQQRRQEEAEKAYEYVPELIIHGDEPLDESLDPASGIQPVPRAPHPAFEPSETHAVWSKLREELRMRLFGHPALRALEQARVLGLSNHRLTVLMPDDASADVWRKRMQGRVEWAVVRAFDEPLSVLFLGPTEMAMLAQ